MIDLLNVSKRYDSRTVVDNVTVQIPSGGLTSIVGPNGAGKSTLLSMISRLAPMSEGQIIVGDMDITKTDTALLAKHLSILRQDNHTPLRLTAKDMVAFGRYPHSQGRMTVKDEKY